MGLKAASEEAWTVLGEHDEERPEVALLVFDRS